MFDVYIAGFVKLVVDVLLDDAGLTHALVAQENQLVFCLVAGGSRREVHSIVYKS